MSKQVIKNYTFNASAKTVTLTDFSAGQPVRLERLALITDTTINQILYNFADTTVATATVSGNNVITLSVVPGGTANADNLRIDYDVITGDPTYDSATNSGGPIVSNGNTATVTPGGALMTSIDPSSLFTDSFEGSVVDTTNRWTATGTVPATQANGSLSVNPSNTASATSALNSQYAFPAGINTVIGVFVALEATIAQGNHRMWGFGVPPSVPGTAAAPLQDAQCFEVDTSGVLRASVYAAGTRVYSQVLTTPVDGLPHMYAISLQGAGTTLFYKDVFTTPVAFTQQASSAQTLPFRIASLNSASVTGTPTLAASGVGILDYSHQSQGLADGTFPWRKATVTRDGGLQVVGTQAATNTTAWTSATTVNTAATIDVSGYNTVSVAMTNTSTMTAGVLTFEVSPDGTNWFPVALARIDSYTVETTYTLNAVANRAWSTSIDGFVKFRVRLSTVITGTGTATLLITPQSFAIEPIVTVGQATAASLNATVTGIVSIGNTANTTPILANPLPPVVSTTGDTGAKTATFNGATLTNVTSKGATVVLHLGVVSGTSPTLVIKLQGSADGGTSWFDLPGATTATITTTGDYGIQIYPGLVTVAGVTTTATTAQVSGLLPKTWRVVYTIGGTTPSFTITNVQISYAI